MSVVYRVGGTALGLAAIILAFAGHVSENVQYKPAAGIAAFAVLYVIAQAVERLVEWVTEGLKLIPASPGAKKERALQEIRRADSSLVGNPSEGDVASAAETKQANEPAVDEARVDIAFLTHGLAMLLAVVAVNWLNYGIMDSLGGENVDGDLNRLITALAAAGGSKGLHELIGRVQVAKEKAQASS